MIRGSGANREIDLEEKSVYAPTPIIEEPYFSLPIEITTPEQRTHDAFPDVDVESSAQLEMKKFVRHWPQRCQPLRLWSQRSLSPRMKNKR